mmetsp:Transcript_13426/g.17384  ORF Transcript_13426/g.17384 Transcript_13426/m.17384 type:complete len:329 (+) Transcript_13426:89-1075(+)
MPRIKNTTSIHVMNTAQAQELLDRNAETLKEIILLQEDIAKPGGLPNAAERKEKLQAKLHKRLLKLARWCDTPFPERLRSDNEYEQQQQRALDLILTQGNTLKSQGRKFSASKTGKLRGPSNKCEGVYADKTGKWVSQISHLGKQYYLGLYGTEEDAVLAHRLATRAIDSGLSQVKIGDNVISLKRDSLSQIASLPTPNNSSSTSSTNPQLAMISPMPNVGILPSSQTSSESNPISSINDGAIATPTQNTDTAVVAATTQVNNDETAVVATTTQVNSDKTAVVAATTQVQVNEAPLDVSTPPLSSTPQSSPLDQPQPSDDGGAQPMEE